MSGISKLWQNLRRAAVRWLAPPAFADDPEQTRRAQLLNAVLLGLLLILVAVIAANLLGGRALLSTVLVDGLMLLLGLGFRGWLRRGRLAAVGLGLAVAIFVFVTSISLTLGTVRSPNTSGYLCLVVLAGALFGFRGILFSGVASSLAILTLIGLENAGLLISPDFTVGPTQWVSFTSLLGFIGILTWYNNRNLSQALARAETENAVRRRAETELRQLSQAVEQNVVSIVLTDPAGRVDYANPIFYESTGYTKDEVAGRDFMVWQTLLTDPEAPQDFWRRVTAVKKWHGELVSRKKDGTLFYEYGTISPMLDPDGSLRHYLVVKDDITQYKRVTSALVESEKRYHLLADYANDVIWTMTPQGKFTYISPSVQHLRGYTPEEVLRQPMEEVVCPGSMEAVQAGLQMAATANPAEAHQPLYFEVEQPCRDGSTVWTEATARMAFDANGQPLGLVGVTRDISERKRADAQIRSLNAQLEQRVAARTAELAAANQLLQEKIAELERSRETQKELYTQYRVVADNTYAWEYWQDAAGKFLYASPSCARISGYAPADFLNDAALLEKIIDPADLPAWQQHRAAELAERQAGQVEFRIGGTGVWIGHICQPVFDEQQQFLGMRCSNRDISEHKQAEAALRREVQRAHTIARITRQINASLKLSDLLDTVATEMAQMMDVPVTMIWLVEDDPKMLYPRAAHGIPPEIYARIQPIANQAVPHREEVFENIYYVKDIHAGYKNANLALDPRGELHTAMTCWFMYEGQPIGMLLILRREVAWKYSDSDFLLLYALSNQIATSIHNAQLYEQVKAGRERLVVVSEKLIEIQEAERRSLALELHDQLGQMLSSAKISLDMIPSLPPAAAQQQMRRASGLVGDLIARVRRMALDLRPSMLDDLGLFATLRWFFKGYQVQTGEEVMFEHVGLEGRFRPQVEITAFRIVQEALTNVIRHAGSPQVFVNAWTDAQALNIQIRDFGAGFDPRASLAAGESSGLSGMRERARLLGGELTLESQPGEGTSLTARLPLQTPEVI